MNLDPKCFKDQELAVTNTGYLVPCCYCDDKATMDDPGFQKLLKVSKISSYDSIDEILNTKQWKKFYERLKRNKGPDACMQVCGVNKNNIREETFIDTNTKNIIKVVNI